MQEDWLVGCGVRMRSGKKGRHLRQWIGRIHLRIQNSTKPTASASPAATNENGFPRSITLKVADARMLALRPL